VPHNVRKEVSEADILFMKRALALAEKGRGAVSPNPMVGAVIVKDQKVVGEGYHRAYGQAHAEVNAINAAGDAAVGGTLYVTLEPCHHTGKTGPCTRLIFESGIARVVVAMVDPNPIVMGQGINFLRSKGIPVTENVLEEKARELNRGYIKHVTTGKPFILLKVAQTLDGRIATSTGHSRWVTGEDARIYVHRMRSENDAVLVGIGTVLADDPHLTVRKVKGPSPKRILLDSQLRVPLDANILADDYPQKTVIFTTPLASKEKISRISERGCTVISLDADERGWITQELIWKTLGSLGFTSVLVEGGSRVHTECIKSGFVDEIVFFIAPKLMGAGLDSIGDLEIRNVNSALELEDVKIRRFEKDIMINAKLKKGSGV